ncbi:hypothetical protein FRC09_011972 [Ceratobasidium sp. 395]|nr:hypothetical protein FRC09_011972 [Ceratobasidium sp. 395]
MADDGRQRGDALEDGWSTHHRRSAWLRVVCTDVGALGRHRSQLAVKLMSAGVSKGTCGRTGSVQNRAARSPSQIGLRAYNRGGELWHGGDNEAMQRAAEGPNGRKRRGGRANNAREKEISFECGLWGATHCERAWPRVLGDSSSDGPSTAECVAEVAWWAGEQAMLSCWWRAMGGEKNVKLQLNGDPEWHITCRSGSANPILRWPPPPASASIVRDSTGPPP